MKDTWQQLPQQQAQARCGCGSAVCSCSVVALDTDCITTTVTGVGTADSPYTISSVPVISPTAGNQLVCSANGLFVPAAAPAISGITTADTFCIDLSGNGTGGSPLSAVPIIDPDPDNQLSCGPLGLFVPSVSGTVAGGDAIITVAAVDTPAIIAANADFVCDGTADQVEILAAIAVLDTAGNGGWVRLLQGTFNTTDPIIPASGSILEGSGRANEDFEVGGTLILFTGTAGTYAIDALAVRSLTLRDMTIQCQVANTGAYTAELGEDNLTYNVGMIQDNGGPLDVVRLGGTRNIFRDSKIYGFDSTGIQVFSGGDDIRILNNYIQADTGISVNGGSRRSVIGNHITQYGSGTDGHGIIIEDVTNSVVNGNIIENTRLDGIQVINDSESNIVSDNVIQDAGNFGIFIEDAHYGIVHDNIVRESTSDGIRITGSSTENSVQTNHIRFTGVAINILGAGATDNLVTNNDHMGMTITNTGTGTVFTAGNRP